MSEWTIEGDESMRWDVIASGNDMAPAAVHGPAEPVKEKRPIPEGMVECDGVCIDGVYHGAGGTVNGKFVGFTGTCYRCGGKGHQTPSDVARNRTYDRNRRFTL